MKKIVKYHILQVYESQKNLTTTIRTLSIQLDLLLLLVFVAFFFYTGLNLLLIEFLKSEIESKQNAIIFGKLFLFTLMMLFIYFLRKKISNRINLNIDEKKIKEFKNEFKLENKIWNIIYRLNFVYLFGLWWIFGIAIIGISAKYLIWIPFNMM